MHRWNRGHPKVEPGLRGQRGSKEEITKGIIFELDGKALNSPVGDVVGLSKMSADQWKAHVLCDRIPFSRECTTCLKGAVRTARCLIRMP